MAKAKKLRGASVSEISPGRFRVFWRDAGGKRIGSEIMDSRAAADAKAREIAAARAAAKAVEKPIAPGEGTLAKLIELWNADRAAVGKAREPWRLESTGHVRRIMDEMGWTQLRQIDRAGLSQWRAKRPNGVGTDKPLQAMKGFLSWCQRRGLPVPVEAVKLEKRMVPDKPAVALLTDQQMAAILARAAAFGPSVLAMIKHLAMYGCRPVDTCKMQVLAWNAATQEITYYHTKNKTNVTHPVRGDHVAELTALAKGRKPEAPMFLHPATKMAWEIDPKGGANQLVSWYKNNIGEHLMDQGILNKSQIGMKQLKKYAMTALSKLAKGNRASVVAITGHKTLSVVDRYILTNKEETERMAEATTLPAFTPEAPSLPDSVADAAKAS